MLYDAIVLPHLSYCNLIWASTYHSSLKTLASLQRRALKLCLPGNPRRSHLNPFNKLQRLLLTDINKLQTAKLIHQILYFTSTLPSSITSLICTVSTVHSHHTRSQQHSDLYVHSCKTNRKKFTFKIMAPTLWAQIPPTIKNLQPAHTFKNAYRNALINSYPI